MHGAHASALQVLSYILVPPTDGSCLLPTLCLLSSLFPTQPLPVLPGTKPQGSPGLGLHISVSAREMAVKPFEIARLKRLMHGVLVMEEEKERKSDAVSHSQKQIKWIQST